MIYVTTNNGIFQFNEQTQESILVADYIVWSLSRWNNQWVSILSNIKNTNLNIDKSSVLFIDDQLNITSTVNIFPKVGHVHQSRVKDNTLIKQIPKMID
jgi:hypothetical protein